MSIGGALLVFGLFALIGAGIGGIGSTVAQRLSNPVVRYRQLFLGIVLPFTLLSYVVFLLLGLGHAIAGGQIGVVGAVLATFAELLAAGLVGLAAYAPAIPGIRSVRGIELSTGQAAIRMGRYILGITVLVTVVVAPLEAGLSSVALLALLATFGIGVQVIAPWFIPLVRSVNTPDDQTAEALNRLQERAGLTVRDVRVLDTEQEGTASVIVRGAPGYRRLFVTSTFLNVFDDEMATALLAVQAGRQEARVRARLIGGLLLALVPVFVALADIGPLWPLVGASLGLIIVSLWVTRRGVWAADDYAVKRVGPDAVADALEQYADVHDMEPPRRRLANPFSKSPPLGNRIDQLRARTETE